MFFPAIHNNPVNPIAFNSDYFLDTPDYKNGAGVEWDNYPSFPELTEEDWNKFVEPSEEDWNPFEISEPVSDNSKLVHSAESEDTPYREPKPNRKLLQKKKSKGKAVRAASKNPGFPPVQPYDPSKVAPPLVNLERSSVLSSITPPVPIDNRDTGAGNFGPMESVGFGLIFEFIREEEFGLRGWRVHHRPSPVQNAKWCDNESTEMSSSWQIFCTSMSEYASRYCPFSTSMRGECAFWSQSINGPMIMRLIQNSIMLFDDDALLSLFLEMVASKPNVPASPQPYQPIPVIPVAHENLDSLLLINELQWRQTTKVSSSYLLGMQKYIAWFVHLNYVPGQPLFYTIGHVVATPSSGISTNQYRCGEKSVEQMCSIAIHFSKQYCKQYELSYSSCGFMMNHEIDEQAMISLRANYYSSFWYTFHLQPPKSPEFSPHLPSPSPSTYPAFPPIPPTKTAPMLETPTPVRRMVVDPTVLPMIEIDVSFIDVAMQKLEYIDHGVAFEYFVSGDIGGWRFHHFPSSTTNARWCDEQTKRADPGWSHFCWAFSYVVEKHCFPDKLGAGQCTYWARYIEGQRLHNLIRNSIMRFDASVLHVLLYAMVSERPYGAPNNGPYPVSVETPIGLDANLIIPIYELHWSPTLKVSVDDLTGLRKYIVWFVELNYIRENSDQSLTYYLVRQTLDSSGTRTTHRIRCSQDVESNERRMCDIAMGFSKKYCEQYELSYQNCGFMMNHEINEQSTAMLINSHYSSFWYTFAPEVQSKFSPPPMSPIKASPPRAPPPPSSPIKASPPRLSPPRLSPGSPIRASPRFISPGSPIRLSPRLISPGSPIRASPPRISPGSPIRASPPRISPPRLSPGSPIRVSPRILSPRVSPRLSPGSPIRLSPLSSPTGGGTSPSGIDSSNPKEQPASPPYSPTNDRSNTNDGNR